MLRKTACVGEKVTGSPPVHTRMRRCNNTEVDWAEVETKYIGGDEAKQKSQRFALKYAY